MRRVRLATAVPAVGAAVLATALVVGTAHGAPAPPDPAPHPASPASGGLGNHLVVLGDSWAAGSAAGDVDRATGACRRSARAYAAPVATGTGQVRWVSRACATGPVPAAGTKPTKPSPTKPTPTKPTPTKPTPTKPTPAKPTPAKPQESSPAPTRPGHGLGSTLDDTLGGVLAVPLASEDGRRADDQFGVVDTHTRAVVATVGGDAVGLGALARACSTAGTAAGCDDAAARTDRALAALPRSLDSSLAAMRRRAPDAALVLSGYPRLTEGVACAAGAADLTRAARVDALVDRLDGVLAARAGAARARFVDVRPAFRGHAACAPTPWLTPLSGPDSLLAGGPTTLGQTQGYAPAVAAAARAGLAPSTPKPTPTKPAPAHATPTTTPAPLREGELFAG